MFRTALRSLGIILVLLVVIAAAPGAWADPGERGRGRSDRSDRAEERRQDGSGEENEDDPDAADETSEEERAEEERPDEGRAGEEQAESGDTPPGNGERRPASDDSPAALADVLDVTFAASPARVAPGETSTLTMTATNGGEETVGSLELLVELPPSLELVSSDPAAASDGRALTIRLDSLAPGDTVQAAIVVRAIPDAGSQSSPVRFALVADDQVFHHEVMVEVHTPSSNGLELTQSGPLLVQVGDVGAFRLRLSNSGDTPLRDVAVVTEIAPELDVVGVTPISEADAIQLGSSRSGEDVVWIFHELDPAESVDLFWTARAAVPGDLEANNAAVALVDGDEVADSIQRTYLGYVEGLQVEREDPPAPVVQRRVVTKLVPVSREVSAAAAGLLPATGASPIAVVGAALLFIVLGLTCVWLSGRTRSVRRGGAVAIAALLLTTTACVSTPESPSSDADSNAQQETPEAAAEPDEVEPDGQNDDDDDDESEREDEVLGVRVERDPPEPGAGGTDQAPSSDATSPDPAAPSTEVVFEEVTVVESILVAPPSLPVREMPRSDGDNVVSITWERASGALTAASSRTLTVDATEEVLTSVVASGPGMTATVTLRNLAEDRLAATGRLRLELEQGEASSILYSERVEVVLDPGEEVSADFTFSLPDGSFVLRGGFEPY